MNFFLWKKYFYLKCFFVLNYDYGFDFDGIDYDFGVGFLIFFV